MNNLRVSINRCCVSTRDMEPIDMNLSNTGPVMKKLSPIINGINQVSSGFEKTYKNYRNFKS